MQRSNLLNDAERQLWDAFPRGEEVDLGEGDPTDDDFDPDAWSDRQVRGEVIARLLLGAQPPEPGYVAKVVLSGARITGELSLDGGTTDHLLLIERCWLDEAPDLSLSTTKSALFVVCGMPGFGGLGWQARGPVAFTESLVNGEVNLRDVHIHGQLSFNGATLTNSDGDALSADGLTVDGDMFCQNGFTATGTIRLPGAHIHGQLNLDGATLTNDGGDALSADGLTVDGDMFCQNGFTATGTIRLPGAHIHGQLSLIGATLTNPDGHALFADRLTVDASMFCRDGFTATGTIRLPGAHIHGQLGLDGATLTNDRGDALVADRLDVNADMFCRAGFAATGAIRLLGAQIKGQLSFEDAVLTKPGGIALDLESSTVGLLMLAAKVTGEVDLTRAKIRGLGMADPRRQPPTVLTGLTYTELDPGPDVPVGRWIGWLRRDPSRFHPQPYEQLAGYYRSLGHDRDARLVLLAKRRDRRHAIPKNWRMPRLLRVALGVPWRAPGWIVDGLAGYGYVPARALGWLVAALIGGTMLLSAQAQATPTDDGRLNAALLTLDSIVPTSPFGLRDQAHLTGTSFLVAMGLQILGYALALAVLPALSRALSRSDK